ncbi:MAG TPA: hypothetical protein VJH24_02160 [Candidatus Bilamarchaeaceae archaeon]|nr:hypothetical protein [Candidatus Bilamarchaeaceae archaeon]
MAVLQVRATQPARALHKVFRNILVLEDSSFTRHAERHLLHNNGHEVRVASTIDQAMAIMRSTFHPDVVIGEMIVPTGNSDMANGAEFLQWAKTQANGHPIWTILLTQGNADMWRGIPDMGVDILLDRRGSDDNSQRQLLANIEHAITLLERRQELPVPSTEPPLTLRFPS